VGESFNDLVDRRPHVARGVASALFALVALSFSFPFVAAESDRRQGSATGIELVAGEGTLRGHYVHDVYRGEVEAFLDRGYLPALIVLGATLAGIAVAWIPWRSGAAAACSLALIGLLGLGALYQATSNAYSPTVQEWHYGFWLAFVGLGLVFAWTTQLVRAIPFWWTPPEPPQRDFFAPRDSA
jgi:hypothetical protein